MAKHFQLTDELQQRARLFVAGSLSESERVQYTRHLEVDDCDVCQREVRAFLAADPFVLTRPLEVPSPRAKEQLMQQVGTSASGFKSTE
jgi:hypothetical protein